MLGRKDCTQSCPTLASTATAAIRAFPHICKTHPSPQDQTLVVLYLVANLAQYLAQWAVPGSAILPSPAPKLKIREPQPNLQLQPGMLAHTCNHSTGEGEAGILPEAQGQHGLNHDTQSQ